MQPPTLPIHESDEEEVDESGPEPAHHATRVSLASWFTSLYVWRRHFGINWEALGLIAGGLGLQRDDRWWNLHASFDGGASGYP